MGKRGPKPTPTPLLKLRGSWRGEIRDGEPDFIVEVPDCPSWVSAKARNHWAEIAEMLAGLNVMARPHTLALALLTDALADWIGWTKAAEVPGAEMAVHNQKGKAWERALKACREFGMTPSAITSVRSVKQDEKPQGLQSLKLA